jgi:aryl-alcohol dehydrogenase-like predicted oxidoreductase
MKTRKLGKLEVSELGFGCMSLATNYGPATNWKLKTLMDF